jgi:hypothetical protein
MDYNMRKLLILLLLILVGCQKMPIYVSRPRTISVINVGTAPNSGNGDPLRTTMIKVNSNFVYHDVEIGLRAPINNPVFTGTITTPSLTLGAEKFTGTKIGVEGADSTKGGSRHYVPWSALEGFSGGGSGVAAETLEFLVGDVGAPQNGDATLTHTHFVGKHVEVYRENGLQKLIPAGVTTDGYTFNDQTGTITFVPVLATGEQIFVKVTDPIYWTSLVLEGGGGGGASSLLTNLVANWELNETMGATVTDEISDYVGTTSGATGQAGYFGYGVRFLGTQALTVPYTAAIRPQGTTYSVSLWFRITELPSVHGHYYDLFIQKHDAAPYESFRLYIENAANKLYFYANNSIGGTYYTAGPAVNINTWYNVVILFRGNGQTTLLYVNGVDASGVSDAFSGTILAANSIISIGNDYNGGATGMIGTIDCPRIWTKTLTSAEITILQTKTWPFN